MAIGDIGIFNPAESLYKTPGAFDESLRADALKRASYLSMMDQFYEQLDETKREFDATLTFKTAGLAEQRWEAEQNISLGKEELQLKREQGAADINLRTKALEEQTAYGKESLAIQRMGITAKETPIKLGRSSMEQTLALLSKYSTTAGQGSNYYSIEGTPIKNTVISGGTPKSGSVDYGNPYSRSEVEQMVWL